MIVTGPITVGLLPRSPSGYYWLEQFEKLKEESLLPLAPRSGAGLLIPEEQWSQRGAPKHNMLVSMLGGEAVASSDTIGLLYSPSNQKIFEAKRKKPLPWSEVREMIPKEHREGADRVADLWFPGRSERKVNPNVACFLEVLLEACRKKGASGAEHAWALARAAWLEADALAMKQAHGCLRRTIEVAKINRRTGEVRHTLSRMRCGSVRCVHCSHVVHGFKWMRRVEKQLRYDMEQGRPLWFLTLTIDPSAFMERFGIPRQEAARALAWRRFSPQLKVFIKALRREGYDVSFFRSIEAHRSGWPHLHLLVRSQRLTECALAEAGVDTMGELVQEMIRRQRDPSLSKRIASWERGGRKGRKPAFRLPYSRTRSLLKKFAARAGFGSQHFWLEPVRGRTPSEAGDLASYVSKDPFCRKEISRVPDAEPGVAYEVSKPLQRQAAILVRGVRCWDASRGKNAFFDAPTSPESSMDSDATNLGPEERGQWTTAFAAIHSAPVETVREHLIEDLDLSCSPGREMVDFRGPIPAKGERRPRLLASTEITVPSLFGAHEEFHREVASVAHKQLSKSLHREGRGGSPRAVPFAGGGAVR